MHEKWERWSKLQRAVYLVVSVALLAMIHACVKSMLDH
jgi:DMSO/TMAO reductase YedYZ heme-binding membrane subunit